MEGRVREYEDNLLELKELFSSQEREKHRLEDERERDKKNYEGRV